MAADAEAAFVWEVDLPQDQLSPKAFELPGSSDRVASDVLKVLLESPPGQLRRSEQFAGCRLFAMLFGYNQVLVGLHHSGELSPPFAFFKINVQFFECAHSRPVPYESPVECIDRASSNGFRISIGNYNRHLQISILMANNRNSPQIARTVPKHGYGAFNLPSNTIKLVTESDIISYDSMFYQRSKSPNDVAFRFPQHSLKLWANSSKLAMQSEYFKTLLSFEQRKRRSASVIPSQGEETSSNAVGTPVEVAQEDSDAEEDTRMLLQKTSELADYEVLYIDITAHAFTTYQALLYYLHGWNPTFNVIKSARIGTYHTYLENFGQRTSPKSLYKLAHEYQISALQKLCLDELLAQISVKNVQEELCSEFASTYSEVAQALIQWIADHAQEVKALMKTT